MATNLLIKRTHSEDGISRVKLADLRKDYIKLANCYKSILDCDTILCHRCGEWKPSKHFYVSDNYASGYYPECRDCVAKEVNVPNETKHTVQKVLEKMNIPYIDSLFDKAVDTVVNSKGNWKSSFSRYMAMIQSLPQYKGLAWSDSEFEPNHVDNEDLVEKDLEMIKNSKKRFGRGYTDEDYLFLANEYQDWITRYECNTKAQEVIFERLSFKKLEINKATRRGASTKDLDKTYQELLATANIQPRQNSMDTMSEAQTFGTLIAKWETERPLPEIDPELEDVDKIGRYIDVFYRGHMAKVIGLKNGLSHIYQKFIEKFTVKRPEYDSDEDSEALFDAIFGRDDIDE